MIRERSLSLNGEEWINSITHGIAMLLSITGGVLMVWSSLASGEVWRLVSAFIYGGSLVFLYAASTFYHMAWSEGWKKWLRILDHVGVFVLIAGTNTPFALVTLRGASGWLLFCTIWGVALIGIYYKLCSARRYHWSSTLFYVLMGWIAVFFLKPMAAALPAEALLWLAAGGLFYTVGVVFFAWDKLPFNHSVWHLFVIAGSACHFVVVARYVLPL